ncbi:MAG: hypothetical protein D6780_01055, partial [Candidatus Dadabacteria bacterium]
MKKEELIEAVRLGAREGVVTKEEMVAIFNSELREREWDFSGITTFELFYLIGVVVSFAGIGGAVYFLLGDWEALTLPGKILGVSAVTVTLFIDGVVAEAMWRTRSTASFFFLLSALPFPFLLVDIWRVQHPLFFYFTFSWLLLTFLYFFAFRVTKRGIFAILTLISFSLFFITLAKLLVMVFINIPSRRGLGYIFITNTRADLYTLFFLGVVYIFLYFYLWQFSYELLKWALLYGGICLLLFSPIAIFMIGSLSLAEYFFWGVIFILAVVFFWRYKFFMQSRVSKGLR